MSPAPRTFLRFLLCVSLSGVHLTGCNRSDEQVPYVELKKPPFEEATPHNRRSETLKIAGAPMISPMEGFRYYQQMLQYISSRLNRPVHLVQRKTYHEINELLRSGGVGAAFICSGAYILDAEPSGIEILVVPYAKGGPYYQAYLITGAHKPFEMLEDLRHGSFAFTDPLSLTGRYYTLYRLKEWGESPARFFSRTVYSGAHDSSIRAVASGQVDAASVDSLIYDYMLSHQAPEISRTKIIEKSEPLGIPPFVVSPHLEAKTREALKQILLEMDDAPEGQGILMNLGLESFRVPPGGLYDHLREILRGLKP